MRPTDDETGSRRLDAAVRDRFSLSWTRARERITRGKIWIAGSQILDIGYRLGDGDDFEFVADARIGRPEGSVLPSRAIRVVDRDIVVVEKVAGMLTVPFRSHDRDTLDRILGVMLAKREGSTRGTSDSSLFVVHRLDKGTSGLLVFARNRNARNHLKDQLREHTMLRRYFALAHGHLSSTTVRSHLVRDRGDGLRGSVEKAPPRTRRRLSKGRIAITHVEVIERLSEATLVSCRLETGRTNQIRIHLSELGHPLVGETLYRRDFEGPMAPASRLCLHAGELGFVHPRTGEQLVFRSDIPDAMQKEIDARRSR